jgi:predicted nucleotidyltransferase component of viral defense system
MFLHNHPEFKNLIENTARQFNIKNIGLVEKDYWLMHSIWLMQQQGFNFHLKGGTSLSKGFGCIHRFSEDIDIHIEPQESQCGFKVYTGKNHDKKVFHIESRKLFYNWITKKLNDNLNGIAKVERDEEFDDPSGRYKNGGIKLYYNSIFPLIDGVKEGILLEVGFGRIAPNQPRNITSWAYEKAADIASLVITDNRAYNVACYEPKYTFVEKLQAVVRKFRLYKEKDEASVLPKNFIRHYYDLYQLIEREDVQSFIATNEYHNFKQEHFGKTDDIVIKNSDAFKFSDQKDRIIFDDAYSRSENLYYKGRPNFQQILDRINQDIEKL